MNAAMQSLQYVWTMIKPQHLLLTKYNFHQMKLLLLTAFISIAHIVSAQYYYNDIITTRQTNRQYKLLKDNNIQEVNAKSFEADGRESEGFELSQQLSE